MRNSSVWHPKLSTKSKKALFGSVEAYIDSLNSEEQNEILRAHFKQEMLTLSGTTLKRILLEPDWKFKGILNVFEYYFYGSERLFQISRLGNLKLFLQFVIQIIEEIEPCQPQ
jgi:hypothetical protein